METALQAEKEAACGGDGRRKPHADYPVTEREFRSNDAEMPPRFD